jgi:hypothetical protein
MMQLITNSHTILNYNAINRQCTYSLTINLSLKCNINNTMNNYAMTKLQTLHLQTNI